MFRTLAKLGSSVRGEPLRDAPAARSLPSSTPSQRSRPRLTRNASFRLTVTDDEVREIGIDDEGRLYVVPRSATFPSIYREAMEVHWDDRRSALYGPRPMEWTYADWFRQILAAARAQGVHLKVTSRTIWVSVSAALRAEMEASLRESEIP